MGRQCWICYQDEENTGDADWVKPCRCRGSTEWVHQSCLLSWISSQLERSSNQLAAQVGGPLILPPSGISCPQCRTPYQIQEKHLLPLPLLRFCDSMLAVRDRIVMTSLVGSVGGALWMVAFVYGAASFSVTVGIDQAFQFFSSNGKPLLNLANSWYTGDSLSVDYTTLLRSAFNLGIAIPYIPLAIIAERIPMMQQVTPYISSLILTIPDPSAMVWSWPPSPRLTALLLPPLHSAYRWSFSQAERRILGRPSHSLSRSTSSASLPPLVDDEDAEDEEMIRVSEESVVSLLLLPAAASLAGWLLFRKTAMHGFHRTLLGGLALRLLLDSGRSIYRYQAEYLKRTRRVLPFSPQT